MPVEAYPTYPKWRAALHHLTETKGAVQRGEASSADLSAAQAEYDRICGEIDEIDGVSDA